MYTNITECISAAMWISIVPNTEPEDTYFGTTWNNFLETKILMQFKNVTHGSRNVFFQNWFLLQWDTLHWKRFIKIEWVY